MISTPYDHLTDQELIRLVQFNDDPLVRSLCERLEMRRRDIQDLQEELGSECTSHLELPPGVTRQQLLQELLPGINALFDLEYREQKKDTP